MCPRDTVSSLAPAAAPSSSSSALPPVPRPLTFSSPWNARAFRALDLDGDGAIRHSDLFALLASSACQNPNNPHLRPLHPSDIEPMIAAADLDGDGAVDIAEFEQQLLLAQKQSKRRSGEDLTMSSSFSALEDVFRMLDSNNDGFLSRDDLRSTMAQCGQSLSEPELDAMLAAASGSGSSIVDFSSFSRLILSLMT